MENEIPASPEIADDKQVRWDEMTAQINRTVDRLNHPVDEGIKAAVVALNLLDMPTSGSCEGHLDRGMGGPYVDVITPGYAYDYASQYKREPENDAALDAIDRQYAAASQATKERVENLLAMFYAGHSCSDEVKITYEALACGWYRLENRYIADFMAAERQRTGGPIDEDYQPAPELLAAAQAEMQTFASWLKQYYFSN